MKRLVKDFNKDTMVEGLEKEYIHPGVLKYLDENE
ncbi:hypothetical protein J2Z82_001254 [Virgibacillus litoralis]|uniref:Uncharacterized protein n=1 Tax=Virgibacillus litoralis TaxID=578221 RepID=A0ABS4HBT8_9BACI|nr:hypothetical protein [Virgibacillus litoralis]